MPSNAQSPWGRAPGRRLFLVPLLALIGVVGGGLWLAFANAGQRQAAYDEQLCPTAPSGLAVMLFDLTKPLAELQPGLPGQLLRDLTLDVERDAEIRTYLLVGSASAPRLLLNRLCKPFDTGAVQVATAKDHDGGTRDCDDLPAQMASDQRRAAFRFCELREAFAARLDTVALRASKGQWEVTGAHLVEALEETRGDFLAHPGSRRTLHVVSDMVQHADWYSHLDLPSEAWNGNALGRLPNARKRLQGRFQGIAGLDVHIHYMPRGGLTALPEAGDSHRRFWRQFFAVENLAFHQLPPLPAYASKPLMALEPKSGRAGPRMAAAVTVRKIVEESNGTLAAGTSEPYAGSSRGRPIDWPRESIADSSDRNPPQPQTVAAKPPTQGEPAGHGDAGQVALPPVVEADAPMATLPVEDAPRTSVGVEVSMDYETVATRTETEASLSVGIHGGTEYALQVAQAGVLECHQDMLMKMLEEEGARWRPDYPRLVGFRDFGDARLAVRYAVNDRGEVEPDSINVLEQESVVEKPRYFDLFAREAAATLRDWRFPIRNSDGGQACVPRPSYETTFQFQF